MPKIKLIKIINKNINNKQPIKKQIRKINKIKLIIIQIK